jgi:hypothetical protein
VKSVAVAELAVVGNFSEVISVSSQVGTNLSIFP